MSVFFYLAALIMVARIAKTFRLSPLQLKWKSLFIIAQWSIIAAYCLLEATLPDAITALIGGGILLYLVSFGLKEDDFKPFKPYLEAHYPLIAVAFVYGLLKLILRGFMSDHEQYGMIAIVAAFIYVLGRWAASKKQMEQINIFSQRNAELDRMVAERTVELTRQKDELEKTLLQLQTTQEQLIQSEKLASLGELTAGIAHEIQNPLNFVNNFSEVSMELIDEMQEELNKGDKEEAIAIAGDLKENLEKIIHHGKRADGIVKGMLQHSRASSTIKEPTDINKLADEYFRLAYHGLRAKDKTFNAELETHFDETLPQVNVVPQDIGRVLLNLFNNAFYAVQQKQKNSAETYKPAVVVSTAVKNNQIIISVKDNGNGIPDAVKDKVMQPFFTTKPTGEGTGLGLSLSYDIVRKGHGGDIKIDSKEGEGSEFMVTLPIS
jgi:two-component system NtrC family sensor kinase